MQVETELDLHLVGLVAQRLQLADHPLDGGLDPADGRLEGHLRTFGHRAAVHSSNGRHLRPGHLDEDCVPVRQSELHQSPHGYSPDPQTPPSDSCEVL